MKEEDNTKEEEHYMNEFKEGTAVNAQSNQTMKPEKKQEMTQEQIIWESEVWKRATQTQFYAHLKQVEYEHLTELQKEFKLKEDEREKEFKVKINELNLLQTRLRKKASELESRENKIILVEEELKLKINEVSRQLINKDDEIAYIKKRFKEEKALIEKDKLALNKALMDKQKELDATRANLTQFKKEVDESPLSIIRGELTRKSIENEEMIKEKNKLLLDLEKSKEVNDKLKLDLIKMKKAFDTEKENMYKQKVDDIEKIKFEIYNQKMSQNDMNELRELRMRIKTLTLGNGGIGDHNSLNQCQGQNQMGNTGSMNLGNSNFSPFNTQQLPNQQQQNVMPPKKEYKILSINRRARMTEMDIKSEIDRLTKERGLLLSGGMYSEGDPLIVQLDIKIRKLIDNSGY